MIIALIVTYFVKTSKKKETTINTQEKSVNDGETQADDSGFTDTPNLRNSNKPAELSTPAGLTCTASYSERGSQGRR